MILSPFGVIAAGHGVQRLAGLSLGVWAWVPTMLVFWGAIAALVRWGGPPRPAAAWLGWSRGSWLWPLLALAVGLLSLREFLSAWDVLDSPGLWVLWLGYGLVNPWFEEGYWRGLLLDATRGWPMGLGVLYSTALFAVSHPLIWGVHSRPLRHPAALVGLALVGIVWSITYRRTGSLRWTIAGHSCSNLLGLSVPILLNLHAPAALR